MTEFNDDIVWGENNTLDIDRLNKMAQNDRYLYEKLVNAPRGVIAWEDRTTDFSISSASGGSTIFTFDATADLNRKLRLTLTYNSLLAGAGSGVNLVEYYFKVDGLMIGNVRSDAMLSTLYVGAGTYHVFYNNTDVNEKTFSINAKRASNFTVTMNAHAFYPIQFVLEDVGSI